MKRKMIGQVEKMNDDKEKQSDEMDDELHNKCVGT